MCGKDTTNSTLSTFLAGSPPHVRERPVLKLIVQRHFGITPACAGKTNAVPDIVEVFEDHPRMCGKDELMQAQFNTEEGSPPHVRERPVMYTNVSVCVGITPACAGKTNGYKITDCTH